jgi:hypothetical protein
VWSSIFSFVEIRRIQQSEFVFVYWKILRDPNKRKQYDMTREYEFHTYSGHTTQQYIF